MNSLKNACHIIISIITNPKRWDNLADAILAFAVTIILTNAYLYFYKATIPELLPSLKVVFVCLFLASACLGLKEIHESDNHYSETSYLKKNFIGGVLLYPFIAYCLYSLDNFVANIFIVLFFRIIVASWIIYAIVGQIIKVQKYKKQPTADKPVRNEANNFLPSQQNYLSELSKIKCGLYKILSIHVIIIILFITILCFWFFI